MSTATSPRTEGDDAAAASERLGAYVRTLRRARGHTLVQLAGLTELSHPFLSQLERGLAQPSMGSLRRIAVALGTSPIELIAASEPAAPHSTAPHVELHRRGEDTGTVAGFAEGNARMLVHGDRPFVPLEYTSDNARPGEYYSHTEDEFVLVLSGKVRADVDGQQVALMPGDSLYYASGVSHRWWSAAPGVLYRLLIVKQQPWLGRRPRPGSSG